MLLSHFTSAVSAIAIVTDAFRINGGQLTEDRCACFSDPQTTIRNHTSSKECELKFEWHGDIREVSRNFELSKAEPNILYIQERWRCIIIPNTTTGLEFIDYEINTNKLPDFRRFHEKLFRSKSYVYNKILKEKLNSEISVLEFTYNH